MKQEFKEQNISETATETKLRNKQCFLLTTGDKLRVTINDQEVITDLFENLATGKITIDIEKVTKKA